MGDQAGLTAVSAAIARPDDGWSRRSTAAALVVCAGIFVGSFVASVVTPPNWFPPVFCLLAAFIAAAFLSVRLTAVVSVLAVAQVAYVAVAQDEYEGGPLTLRIVFASLGGALAVVLAVLRVRRERQLAEARLDLRQADLLRALAATSHDPIFVKDPEGRYLVANDAVAQALGRRSAQELIGRRDRELVPADVADWIEADDQRVLRSGGTEEFEDNLETADGPRIYLTHKSALRDEAGSVVAYFGVAKDVTTRRRAQRELASSERRFRSLVEATSAIVWQANPQLEFVEPQPGWERYTGQTWTEERGRGWIGAFHPLDRDRLTGTWSAPDSPRLFEGEHRLWHASTRSYRHVVSRAVPIVGDDGRILEWVGTFSDVHDRVVAERQVERLAAARRLVAEAASRVALASNPSSIASEALRVLGDHLPPHSGSVALNDPEEPGRWHAVAFSGARPELAERWRRPPVDLRVPAADVFETGRPLEFPDVEQYALAYPELADAIRASGIRGQSFLVPLTSGARVLGVVALSYIEPVEDEMALSTRITLEELAPVIGHRLDQAQFLELEARIASSFQHAMLELRHRPDPRLEVSTSYSAGSTVLEAGGDWYDVIAMHDGRIALTVGDVVGRSLRAATVMGRLRTAMRALVLALENPAACLEHLDALVETIDDAPFTTCACLMVDPGHRRVTYANAGHPPALAVTPSGAAAHLEGSQGPPLGVRMERRRWNAEAPLEVGDRLLLYTDGLVERRKEPLDEGLARLRDAAVALRDRAVERLPSEIERVVFADYEQRDDVAMICAELTSESADRFHRRIDPDPVQLRTVRRSLTYWVAAGGTDDRTTRDVALAVGEALANAIEHGDGEPGSVGLELHRREASLQAEVRSEGAWRQPRVDPTRGRGLQIMRSVAEAVRVDAQTDGTTVSLTFPLGARRGA